MPQQPWSKKRERQYKHIKAKRMGIEVRSRMTKQQLQRAVDRPQVTRRRRPSPRSYADPR